MSEEIIEEQALQTVNPATGKELKGYPQMGDSEVEAAIEKCHEQFLEWKFVSLEERAKVISAIGEHLIKNREKFEQLMTDEMGKLLKQSKQEVDLCAAICNYTAENSPKALADEERELANGGRGIITYSPIGVIYGIQPWNFPAYQVFRYAIANLMAGNGVLLKHASSVTGSALMIQRIFEEAGLPKGLFAVLLIDHDQSNNVITHKRVRGVTLTGSASAGKIVAEKAASVLKKTVMELGSNDAYIVLSDADIEKAVKYCVQGRIYNNGETCVASKRFIVVDEVYEAFKEAFVKQMKAIKTGDPNDENMQLGPMARKDLRETLHEQVRKSVEKGATVLCGGSIPEGEGYYYPTTVLADLEPGQPAYDDELFGPVASLIQAKDTEDAFRIANDSRFGLGGGIFTKDREKAIALAKDYFDTGMVFINNFGLAQPNMPFGGVKDSGYGREHGGFGIKEFLNVKSIMVQ